jgi:hypothetical protein
MIILKRQAAAVAPRFKQRDFTALSHDHTGMNEAIRQFQFHAVIDPGYGCTTVAEKSLLEHGNAIRTAADAAAWRDARTRFLGGTLAGSRLICLYSTNGAEIGRKLAVEAWNGKAAQLTVPAAGFVVYG